MEAAGQEFLVSRDTLRTSLRRRKVVGIVGLCASLTLPYMWLGRFKGYDCQNGPAENPEAYLETRVDFMPARLSCRLEGGEWFPGGHDITFVVLGLVAACVLLLVVTAREKRVARYEDRI